MNARRLVVRGETYVSLEAAAECYQLELAFVREVYRAGLLGPGELTELGPAIPAPMLGRLARIVRLTRHLELDLDLAAFFLEDEAAP